MKEEKKTKGYWNSYEHCYEAAQQCKTRNEFARKFGAAYNKSRENGWINDYTWFLDGRKLLTKWNEQTCYEAALQCKTKTEFENRFGAAYNKSRENGWINDYTWFEQQYNGFKDFIYIYEFPNNVIYVGRSIKPKQRDWQHIFKNKKDSVNEYAVTYNGGVFPKMQIIEECDNATIGAKREQYWMDYYRNNGYTLLNQAKGGSVGSLGKGKWNEETCYEAAQQCKTRTEFNNRFGAAYQKSLYNGWLKDYTWFVNGNKLAWKDKVKWTKEACYEAAKTCTTRNEFKHKFGTAYNNSRKNGWLDDFFPTTKQAA